MSSHKNEFGKKHQHSKNELSMTYQYRENGYSKNKCEYSKIEFSKKKYQYSKNEFSKKYHYSKNEFRKNKCQCSKNGLVQ